jgi:RNA polymerase sigma factor (sigma-70 family)
VTDDVAVLPGRRGRRGGASVAADRYADYAAFYVAQFRPVVRTVYLILYDREHAEDVTQDAFVQLYLHWPKVSRYDAPHAWVRRIAIRMAVRAAERERRRLVLSRLALEPLAQGPAPLDVDLLRATAALPAQQRAAIVLYYYEDRPVAEVAALLDCSVAAAKVLLHRARRALAARLDDEELDDVR